MTSTVHVENISTKTSEDEIKSFFSFCGKIQDISVKSTGNDTQSASVTFEKAAAAKTALLLDSTQLGPNSVHVKSAGGDSTNEKSGSDETHEGDHISQEQKPRARIVAEYLAHGYVISDKAIESALAADKQHGYSTKFLQTLQNIDSKTQASQKAQAVDQKLGLSNKALGAWAGLTSYFDKAQGTPTGQKLRAFYDQGNKTVMDVHNEARHLADLKKSSQSGSDGKPTKEQADVHGVGNNKTQCNCGSVSDKCPCPDGQCACSGCDKAEDGGMPSKEEANVHDIGNGKTQCNCGAVSGKCPCADDQCACEGCAKADGNVHGVGNGKTQCGCGSVAGKCPCPEAACSCSAAILSLRQHRATTPPPTAKMSTGAKKRIMKEYGECMADMPAGTTINFNEQNITKWEVLMDGPEQSVYAVWRALQARDHIPQRVSLQAAGGVVPHQNLPPQRQQRRQGLHVSGPAARGRVEAAEQGGVGAAADSDAAH
ncbi:hypothetical protein OPT61_g6471 [Boeremia exigua]|uniref:Uncharacterized protein n=1 Tax=Boeremia exigua TaxID=749465 RepID=A0ACC2I6K1_9PLEO|nr:hypothetical protein OPT61_g6471 [Boeremia exigua]